MSDDSSQQAVPDEGAASPRSRQPSPEWVAAHTNEYTGESLARFVCGCGRVGQTDLFDGSGYGSFEWDTEDLDGWDIWVFDRGHCLVRCPECSAATR